MDRNLRMVMVYFLYLFSAWSVFRYFVRLPEIVEELWFKPVLFLVPLFFIYMSKGEKPKLWRGNIFSSLVLGLIAGVILRVVFYMTLKQGLNLNLEKTMVAVLIATVEQVTFAGLVLVLVRKSVKNSVWASIIVAIMYGLIHIPILWLTQDLWINTILGVFLLNFCISFIANLTFLNTKNISGSILIEALVLI